FDALATAQPPAALRAPADLYGASRRNSAGFDLSDEQTLARINAAREVALPDVVPLTVSAPTGTVQDVTNPATGARLATVLMADADTTARAI
ncbi:hypothetical protein WAH84_20895, partial [Acinetobacter baumannii]